MKPLSVRSFLAVLALGGTLVAQQPGPDPRLVRRLDASTRTAVVAIIDSARASGLPTEPLVAKALEGAARGASAPMIVGAVRTFASQLGQARRALGSDSRPDEIVGGAQAIRAGISTDQLEKLRNIRAGTRIAAALTVVSDMVAREVPVDTAVSVVSGLLRATATDEQLLTVRAEIETDILGGKSPALAASIRGQALEQTLAADVVPNGAGTPGALPSPSGTNRAGDGPGALKPPASAVGGRSPAEVPSKPPVQRKRPSP